MRLTKLFNEFYASEKAGGALLIICTAASLFLANSAFGNAYDHFWHSNIDGQSLVHWINDGLMAIFFLLIGLELEREFYHGELSNLRNALLPVAAAAGGMIVPAVIYLFFNLNIPSQSGFGIPVSTDIAFSIGVLALLGKRIPPALKILILSIAIIDDLGAILVIAIFYAQSIIWSNLGIALSVFVLLLLFNRLKVNSLIPYIIGGVVMWYFMHLSGIHPGITGVLIAFAIPFRKGGKKSPSYMLQHWLNRPVAFFILPLFALANTAIVVEGHSQVGVLNSVTSGIFLGLVIGKPVGILIGSYIMVASGICVMPENLNWKYIVGVGILGGIGFTMSIFITNLAFSNMSNIDLSKMSILLASFSSGLLGYLWLRVTSKKELK